MNYKIGDLVSRKSHNRDVVFKIIKIENNIAYLTGLNYRLCADALLSDNRNEIL